MMRGINDQAWRADLLADVLHAYGDWGWVHVNLIPLNPTPGSKWTASDPADEREFVRRLEASGIPTTVRDTRGREIDGACGQLAATASARRAQSRRVRKERRRRQHAARRCGRWSHRGSRRRGCASRSRRARGPGRPGVVGVARCCPPYDAGPAWSTIVVNSDSVPSRLSATSMIRDC